jgi:hypothetical protein
MNPSAVLQKLHPFGTISKITWMAMSMFPKGTPASNDDSVKLFKGNPSECQSSILSIIEAEIIPRLLKAERINLQPPERRIGHGAVRDLFFHQREITHTP